MKNNAQQIIPIFQISNNKIMKRSILVTLFAVTLGFNHPSLAQVSETYELSLEGAMKIAEAAKIYAEANNAPGGAIAIVDAGGNLIYLIRLTGTFPASSQVSIGKARTAAMFRFPSKKLEDAVIHGRTSLNTAGFVTMRGGEPIVYNGKVIGGIGVSGAASADQDVEIAKAGVKAKFY